MCSQPGISRGRLGRGSAIVPENYCTTVFHTYISFNDIKPHDFISFSNQIGLDHDDERRSSQSVGFGGIGLYQARDSDMAARSTQKVPRTTIQIRGRGRTRRILRPLHLDARFPRVSTILEPRSRAVVSTWFHLGPSE